MMMSTARRNDSVSNTPSSRRYLSRLSEARLHAELSRCIYSEQGLDALMRAVFEQVCQSLIVESYCMPGSPQKYVLSAIMRRRSRALKLSQGWPLVTYLVCHSRSSCTACMNSSLTRTELLAFWKNTLPYAGPSRLAS